MLVLIALLEILENMEEEVIIQNGVDALHYVIREMFLKKCWNSLKNVG